MTRFLALLAVSSWVVLGSGGPERAGEATARGQAPLVSQPAALRVDKTRILNSRGEPVRLRGVNAACLEWTADGEGHILDTVRTAIDEWHVNHVRLPLSQDRWFGKAPEQKDDGKAYRALVDQVVELCAQRGCYVILDLHWSDAGEWGKQIGQHVMPDVNSAEFWKSCASVYKNRPAVIFDLYNEPHDVSWDVWRNGGEVTEKAFRRNPQKTYRAVGMQVLLDTVRATGATNVVIAGGLNWAYDMSGFLDGKPLADRDGNGVIYANHAYPFKGDTIEKWVAKMERAAAEVPIIVSEFGAESRAGAAKTGPTAEEWVRRVLTALDQHNWNWSAWDMHPGAGPRLISDWKYTPTPAFGRLVKQNLAGTVASPPLRSAAHAAAIPARSASEGRSLASVSAPPVPARSASEGQPDPSTGHAMPVQDPKPGAVGALGIFENHGDVGTVLHAGSAAYDMSSQSYTVAGSGQNMWFAEDDFQFVWKKAAGDLTLTADIAFIGAGKEAHRKACLMIRQSLEPDSAYVDAALHGDGLTSLQFREAKGAATHEVQANVSAPKRLRIEKRGNMSSLSSPRPARSRPFRVRLCVSRWKSRSMSGWGFARTTRTSWSRRCFPTWSSPKGSPRRPADRFCYSTLETQTISSTDRRVVARDGIAHRSTELAAGRAHR